MSEKTLNADENNTYIENWEKNNEALISGFVDLVEENKSVIVEGPVHSGKTSLALAGTNRLKENYENLTVSFTTPAVQENFNSMPVKDRTGIEYKKLPPMKVVLERKPLIIVIDEISSRAPDKNWVGLWKKYAKFSNVKVVFLSHPDNDYLKDWKKILDKEEPAAYKI